MNLTEIQDLIKFVSKSGVSEVEIEKKDFKIIIKTVKPEQVFIQGNIPQMIQTSPAQQGQPAVTTKSEASNTPSADSATEDSKLITIKSPMIGTFYRSSSPEKDPFVQVGDIITKGSPVCIIEAMKLFNEIESEISGKVIKVLVDDASPVEYDQPLFLIEAS